MKRFMKTKAIRLAAAGTTLLLLLALLAPYASAEYIEKVAQINTSLSDVSNTQADNLFIRLMNEMYPVGSIYMSTDISDVADIIANFGGGWEAWGQGKVPVAAGSGFSASGGTLGGTVTASVTTPDYAAAAGGFSLTPSLTTANVAVTGTASVGARSGGAVSVSGTQELKGYKALSVSEMPSHRHEVTWYINRRDWWSGTSGNNTVWRADRGSGTVVYSYSDNPNANTSSCTVTVHANTAHTATALEPVVGTINVGASPYSGTLSAYPAPSSYTPPTLSYTQDSVSGHNLSVSVSGTISVNDSTLQPYITCYMYRRTSLAPYN